MRHHPASSRSVIAASVLVAALQAVAPSGLHAQTAGSPRFTAQGVTPAYIVVNTPTPVTFTAGFADALQLPVRVNLLTTDAAGNQILGTAPLFRNDGLDGDAMAGDVIFTYRLTITPAAVGDRYYRIAATFGSTPGRFLSSVLTVHVDPFLLPPDPGEPGTQTVIGFDVDHDGVRDDVQRFIKLGYTDQTVVAALLQYAKAYQLALGHAADGGASHENADKLLRSSECMYSIGKEQGIGLLRDVAARMINTIDRAEAYFAFQQSVAGLRLVASDPSAFAASCQP